MQQAQPRLAAQETMDALVRPILQDVHLDPCADPDAPSPALQRLTGLEGPTSDGLNARWSAVGRNVWLFPPNRREELHGHSLDNWVAKAYREFNRGATVLALLPQRLTSAWFFDFVCRGSAFTIVRHDYAVTGGATPGQLLTLWTKDPETMDRYLSTVADNGITVNLGL